MGEVLHVKFDPNLRREADKNRKTAELLPLNVYSNTYGAYASEKMAYGIHEQRKRRLGHQHYTIGFDNKVI